MSSAPAGTDQVFHLPDLGEGLTEAEVLEWHVAEGDTVSIDQDVVTVETAKAAVSVPCPFAGTVAALHGGAGDTLEVGQPLLTIRPAGSSEQAPADLTTGAGAEQYRDEERAGTGAPERPLIGYGAAEQTRRTRGSRRRAPGAPQGDAPVSAAAEQTGAVKVISPLVRRLATDAGLDLHSLTPSDPSGVLRRADIERVLHGADAGAGAGAGASGVSGTREASSARPAVTWPDGADAERIPLTGLRRTIADKLSRSRREIPDATTWVDADATALIGAKDALRAASRGPGQGEGQASIGVLALMARIAVAGLQRYPDLNSSVDEQAGEIVRYRRVHLGFAAEGPRGLVVPVVHNADALSTAELAGELRRLTDAARIGTIAPAELTGGTFTLNNYGVFGVDGSTPIINHPEAAMLGIGRIIDRPWAVNGELALRKVVQLSFSFDHRVCDGGVAGGFLRFVADAVENPIVLLADL